MSGRYGYCCSCNKLEEGIYTMDVCRGWTSDQYNFNVEICESCLNEITKNWDLGEEIADTIYVSSRVNDGSELKMKERVFRALCYYRNNEVSQQDIWLMIKDIVKKQ